MTAPRDDLRPPAGSGQWSRHPTLAVDLSNTIETPSISGIQRVAFGLTEALSRRWPLVVLDGRQGSLVPADRLARSRLRRLQRGRSGANILGRLESRLRRVGAGRSRGDSADDELAAGDVLIDVESSWHAPQDRADLLPRLAGRSITSAAVLHDILPITDPQWFPPESVDRFTRWFDAHVAADSVLIAVSNATADAAAERVGRRPSVMRMGVDPGPTSTGSDTAAATGRSGVMMVGTVEPRKGHALLLDALDLVGPGAPVVDVVGRLGWVDPALIDRLEAHPQVRWHRGADDRRVDELWASTGLLLQPTLAEGYGLPVVEALRRGVAVAASDLPVMREAARDQATFVAQDPAAWAEVISRFSADPPAWPQPESITWPTWDDSADDVIAALRAAGRWPHPDPPSR